MRKDIKKRITLYAVLAVIAIGLVGCSTAYYKTMEVFGYHKRDLLVERVEDARNAQEDAKEQFQSALEKFSAVVDFKGGELEERYKELKNEFESSESKANAVRKRIKDVEDVSEALFKEWESELGQYTNDRLRRLSEKQLGQTRQSYSQLISAMKRAESKMEPVLSAFRDQVLFLKHNLNAQAVASLREEMVSIEADITSLIKEMEASIAEADEFIGAMTQQQ